MAILDDPERARRMLARYGVHQQQAEQAEQQPQQQPAAAPSDLFGTIVQGVVEQALQRHAQVLGQFTGKQAQSHPDELLAELQALRADLAALKSQLATRPQPSGRGYTFSVERDFNGRMTRVHARPSDKVGQS